MPEFNLANELLPKELKFKDSFTHRNGYLWDVVKVSNPFEICPKCAQPTSVRCGKAYSTVREAAVREKPLWLRIQKHRYFCKHCKKPFTESVEGIWPRRKTTSYFRKTVASDCEKFTNLSLVRKRHQCSSGFLYKVHYETLKTKLRERVNAPWPKVLGIDEHFFTRRNGYTEFATVFCDLKKHRLFEICKGKDTESITELVEQYSGREAVEVVVIDLSSGYRSIVKKLFPNAIIVADKFHVLRLLNPALKRLQRLINGNKLERRQKRLILQNRNRLNLAEKIELDQFLEKHPDLEELYLYKEKLRNVFKSRNGRQARRQLDLLIENLKNSLQAPAQTLGRTLRKWRAEVLAYFIKKRWTNGFTESMNGTAKALQRRARGFKNFLNYRLKILNACYY